MVVPMSRDAGRYLTAEQARRIDEAADRESHEALFNPVSLAPVSASRLSSRVARRRVNFVYQSPTRGLVDDAYEVVGNTCNVGFEVLHNFYKIIGLE